MSDISGLHSATHGAWRVAKTPSERSVVPSVERDPRGQGLSGHMLPAHPAPHPRPRRNQDPAEDVNHLVQDRPRLSPDMLTGPSPAFQASILELEQDLQNTIARVEAARGKQEAETASGLPTRPHSAPGMSESTAVPNPENSQDTGPTIGETDSDAQNPPAESQAPQGQTRDSS